MIRTLTSTGVQKIGRRFIDSIDHAAYTLNGEPQTIPLFRKSAGDEIRIYIYFYDTFLGDVAQVELIDTDGDTVASAGDRVFTKTPGKGLYIAFKYSIAEMEVTEEDGTL